MSDRRILVALLALLVAAPVALAQDAAPSGAAPSGENRDRGSDRGGDRGGDRGRFDPARMAEYMKERMGATDEEWKVIEPKLTKVMEARRESSPMVFGFGGRGGRDGESSNTQDRKSVV